MIHTKGIYDLSFKMKIFSTLFEDKELRKRSRSYEEMVVKTEKLFGEMRGSLSDFGVYLRLAFLFREDKRDMKRVERVWKNEIFELGLGGWVRNIAGRSGVPGFKDCSIQKMKVNTLNRGAFASDSDDDDMFFGF